MAVCDESFVFIFIDKLLKLVQKVNLRLCGAVRGINTKVCVCFFIVEIFHVNLRDYSGGARARALQHLPLPPLGSV